MRAIPLILTTTMEIPMILRIQRSDTAYICDEDEDRYAEVLYLPCFEERESRKRRD